MKNKGRDWGRVGDFVDDDKSRSRARYEKRIATETNTQRSKNQLRFDVWLMIRIAERNVFIYAERNKTLWKSLVSFSLHIYVSLERINGCCF